METHLQGVGKGVVVETDELGGPPEHVPVEDVVGFLMVWGGAVGLVQDAVQNQLVKLALRDTRGRAEGGGKRGARGGREWNDDERGARAQGGCVGRASDEPHGSPWEAWGFSWRI